MSKIAVRDRFGDTWSLEGKAWRQIGVVLSEDLEESKEYAQETNRRLVTCWNEHDDLVKERDELVAALREFFEKGYSSSRSERIKKLLKKYPEAS